MSEEARKCPYCGHLLTTRPYWKHIQEQHPKEYETDKKTWIELYNDYTSAGMDSSITLMVISEIFNKDVEIIKEFLKKNKVI